MNNVNTELSPDKHGNYLIFIFRKIIRFFRMFNLRLSTRFKLIYGHNAYIGKRSEIYIPNKAKLGNHISIGSNFTSHVNFEIGDECLLSSYVSFIGNDHDLIGGQSAYFSGRLPPSRIILEGNNFIGFGSTILGNITIGKGAIIGAHTLVNKDVPPNAIVVGVPGKIIKYREQVSTK